MILANTSTLHFGIATFTQVKHLSPSSTTEKVAGMSVQPVTNYEAPAGIWRYLVARVETQVISIY